MSSTATAAPFFFDAKLLASRDPETAKVSQSAWVENLAMGTHAALQLALNLQTEMKAGAPSKDTIRALYDRVLSLSSAHEFRPTDPSYSRAISEPLRDACQAAQAWYTGCFNPQAADANRGQTCPTPVAVAELVSKLKSVIATDEDGQRVLDLFATSEPFFNRYNVSCKPHQVFDTPVELFQSGRPLAWMAGAK